MVLLTNNSNDNNNKNNDKNNGCCHQQQTRNNQRIIWPHCPGVGVYVKGQYTLNAYINGDNTEISTVVRKVVYDQFVFSPFINYPLFFVPLFRYRDTGFSCQRFRASLRDRRGLLLQYCSMNVTNWCTWLPGVSVTLVCLVWFLMFLLVVFVVVFCLLFVYLLFVFLWCTKQLVGDL